MTKKTFITANSLKEHLNQDPGQKIAILDGTFTLPGNGDDAELSFRKSHIPGAQFFDIEAISDPDTDLPHMLPSPDDFAQAAGALGISNDHEIVIYGQQNSFMGPARVWWMFKVFGHDNVSVLDGGLAAWKAAGGDLTDRLESPDTQKYTPNMQAERYATLKDIRNATLDNKSIILDARPPARFNGETDEPRPGLRAGHIPGSYNVPASALFEPENGRLKSEDALKSLLTSANVDEADKIYTSCGSGVTACALALALETLGYGEVAVYDGSWAEWGSQ